MRVFAGAFCVALAAAVAVAGPDAPRGLALDVEVTTEDGRPVAGARVDAFEVRPSIAPGGWMRANDYYADSGLASSLDDVLDPEHARRTHAATSTTDAAGRARVEGLAPRRWTFVVRAAGRPVERRTVVVPGCDTPLRFALGEGHPLEGRVIDAEGRPYAGALVVASYDARDGFGGDTDVSPFDPWTRADVDGRYRFGALPDGAVEIRAAPRGTWGEWDGWRSRFDEVRIPDVRTFDLVVRRRGPIVGVVRDVITSKAVPAAVVECGHAGACRARVVADALGRFEVPTWTDDSVGEIAASAPGFHAVASSDGRISRVYEVAEVGPTRLDGYVQAGATLRGRVACGDRPVADAWVRIGADGDYRAIVARTDADGRYASPTLPAGATTVAAFRAERVGARFSSMSACALARGDATADVVVAIPTAGDATCDLVLPPPTKPRLRGVVVDPHGDPVRRATVTASDGIARRTDDDGFFELPDLGPEPATFSVVADRFVPQRVPAVADTAQPMVVRLAWERAVRVRGVVRSADGESAKSGAVLVVARAKERLDPAEIALWAFQIEARRNAWTPLAADGTFDVVLPVGGDDEVDVAARVPGHAVMRRRVLDLPDDGAPIDVPIPLAAGATFSGRVVSGAMRTPVAGAKIRLSLRDVMVIDGPRPSVYASTDGDGAFVVHYLPPVALKATASAPGLGRDEIDVAPKAGESPTAEFVLPEAGLRAWHGHVFQRRPKARLIDEPNTPLAGWIVEGYRRDRTKRLDADQRVRATTDAEGVFDFGGTDGVGLLLAYPPKGVPGGPRSVYPDEVPSFRDDGTCSVREGSIVAFEVVDEGGAVATDLAYRVRTVEGMEQSDAWVRGAMICMDGLAPDARVSIHVEKDGFAPIDVADVPAGTTRLRLVMKRRSGK